ncbi:hypothetical protein [Hymenobacter jeollabukensis]|uniref:Uncharacterized protein n=1 Tax=Hymenobacter jeollabukensis TaxID=2025313 RepID=A0A5R8WT35_9BACT|nr:hypothetical protein [Hymenobacter jeollabukensis]TLM93967.1 hypothetical protein FDY95_08005 [Hymenobacter jeollabukensis]
MLTRYTLLFAVAALSLASCQTTKSAVTAPRWEFTTVAATDSTEAVVLMHDSQSPEPTRAVVSMREARALSAERAGANRR